MTVELENKHLKVQIAEHGAEIQSVKSTTGIEYIWQADPKIWGRHAPILFPFVGRLKDDSYEYQGQKYPMGQHGFARDMDFSVVEHDNDHAIFELDSDEETLAKYPFKFKLRVEFKLKDQSITENYYVKNTDNDKEMYFSIGGHPGFNLHLGNDDSKMENTILKVKPSQHYDVIPLEAPYSNVDNLTDFDAGEPLLLSHDLFDKDAIILKLNQQKVELETENSINKHGVTFEVENAPYLGIWSPYPKQADFICLEPWWGLADTVKFNGELPDKVGINKLAPLAEFNRGFKITFK